MTRLYAEVIGDPIAQSKSPLIHNFWLEKLGIDAEYRACHVRSEELSDYFAQRREDANWRGCNVTIPHKGAVLDYCDNIEASAAEVGAANCIVPKDGRLVASNTDTAGVDAALPGVHDAVCIIGAGGAARAAIPSLDVFCALDIRIVTRNAAKAAAALKGLDYEFQFFEFDDACEAMKDVDGVINASPLGMVGQDAMPATVLDALSMTRPDAYVFDMVYAPLQTELLRAGARQGRRTIDGLVMLVGQAKFAFRSFFGQNPDQAVRKFGLGPWQNFDAELRALLTA